MDKNIEIVELKEVEVLNAEKKKPWTNHCKNPRSTCKIFQKNTLRIVAIQRCWQLR